MRFEQVQRSHVGCRRKVNEDALLARQDIGLWAVADGVGGQMAGDVASALVNALEREGLAGKSFNLVGDVRLSAAEYVDLLRAEGRRDFRLHRQGRGKWLAIDLTKWAVKAVARKRGNTFPSWRDLASRSLAARFDCRLAKDLLGWRPVADREEFIERGIRQALGGLP